MSQRSQPHYQAIIQELDKLMQSFHHHKKDLSYGYRRTFDNGMWFDVIDYSKTGTIILRVSRGARLIRQYPPLYDMFDEVAKVIAKMQLPNIQTIHNKHLEGLFRLLDQAPAKIGAFD